MLYAQHMSEIHTGHFRILGRSVAGESTAIVVPEFDCMFDIGCLPPKAFAIGTLFLSHGHFDHAGCLPSFLSYKIFSYAMLPPLCPPQETPTRRPITRRARI